MKYLYSIRLETRDEDGDRTGRYIRVKAESMEEVLAKTTTHYPSAEITSLTRGEDEDII